MASIEVEVAGRRYDVACRDGEEEHLRSLAAVVDRRAHDAASALGGLTETRQLLFAALLLADDLKERRAGWACPTRPAAARSGGRRGAGAARQRRIGEAGTTGRDPGGRARGLRGPARLSASSLLSREADGYCPVRAFENIPEAIRHPRGLSLPGPWLDAYGPHLTFWRQRIFQQTAMAVPSPPPPRAICAPRPERRRDFARSLTPEPRADLEAKLAQLVLPHLIEAHVVAAYHPLKDEISPYPILERSATASNGRCPGSPATTRG